MGPQEVTLENGPMRIIPKTGIPQKGFPPELSRELEHSKLSTCPLKKGSALIRDLRVWHGGTPNFSARTRFLPGIEFMDKSYASHCDNRAKGKGRYRAGTMPRSIYEKLDAYGRLLAEG